ncbi:MAG: GNAT family N-acetyltransferase [Myxococcota bacterium]
MEITTSTANLSMESDGYSVFDDVSSEPTKTESTSWTHVTSDARLRSDGVLTPEELNYCRQHGIATAYDPIQYGWVPAHVEDDVSDDLTTDSASERTVWNAVDSTLAKIERMFTRELDRLGTLGQPESAVDKAWRRAEHLVAAEAASLPSKARLALLRRLQARAAGTFKPMNAEYQRSDDVELRPWTDGDVELYRSLLDNPKLWQYLPESYPAPLTTALAADLIRVSNETDHHDVRAIEYRGEIVGQVRLLFSNQHQDDAEISYWIGEKYWGQGIASRVIPMFSALSFAEHPKLRSIFAKVHKDNAASAVVIERAGYRDEGELASELAGDRETRIFRTLR